MSLMSSDRYLVASGIVAAAFVVTFLYNKYQVAPATKKGIPLPPGPPARWFWDSAFPRSNISYTLGDWVAKYGPVISLRQGSQVTIVIGRLNATTEIMEKEGAALVDRPRSVAFAEIIGERFRRLRKAVHTHLQPRAVQAYEGLQCEHARDVILDILRDPTHHVEHAKRFTVAIILRVVYGKSTPTFNDDPEVVRMRQNIKNSESVLRRLGELRKYHEFELSLYRDQLGRVKDEMSRNEAGPSFSKTLLENASDHRLSHDEMAYLAGILFGAGSDTTYIAISNFILAAARHPAAQARVQEELDMVVGTDRGEPMRCNVSMYNLTSPLAPTFEDSNRLPQLHAFMSEALRWRPVVSAGVAHRATEDNHLGPFMRYASFLCTHLGPIFDTNRAISRDPVAFPDPEKFDPQRWLDLNGQLRADL
ncbi:cytochrome P450, partial [Melanogaster broomeanus]